MSELWLSITGHRPKDLVWPDGRPVDLDQAVAAFLARAVRWAQVAGHDTVVVVTGGAIGVDQAVAEAVSAAGVIAGVRFISELILPFPVEVQGARWRPTDRARLHALVAVARSVTILAERYAVHVLFKRNEAMVDATEGLVAFWTGKREGGTYGAISYALRRGKRVRNALRNFAEVTAADLTGETP